MKLGALSRPGFERLGPGARRASRIMSWVLFWFLVVLVLWDVALALNDEPLDTWSEQTRLAAPRWPVLPWIIGAIIGHLFPPRTKPAIQRDTGEGVMVILTGVMAVWSIAINAGLSGLASPLALWMLAGAGMGAAYFLWPSVPPSDPEASS